MKDLLELINVLNEEGNILVIILSIILFAPFLVKILKEISTISHSIEIKNIQEFSSAIDENCSVGAKYKLERYFSQCYKRSFTYNEINHLLSFESPSTAIKDYIWGMPYLKFDQGMIKYNKDNHWFKAMKWFYGGTFLISMFVALISFILFLAGMSVGFESATVFNLALLAASSSFFTWYALNGSRAVHSAMRVIKNQPTTTSNTQVDKDA